MKFAIITGASKGLGAAIATRLLGEDFGIFSVSRMENEDLRKHAEEQNLFCAHFPCDLSDPKSIEITFSEIVEKLGDTDELWVFNNAGVVEPIEKVGKLDTESVVQNLNVNLLAPILITNLLTQRLAKSKVTFINVTSGAAERPIHGWSTYCSTKAAVNMFTQAGALEQETSKGKHVMIGFSPGIMDTDMQQTIRSSSKEAFHDIEKFKSYKEEGQLRSAATVANALIDLLLSGSIVNGEIYHVNKLI
ncbi:(S)-benzoin forming benzil reductase [Robertmurraya kyonggiensis]|uniref:(S)-benzoin forming benzil reductase n=1 Tax=Robertmurraya kyonggiensis TaxID=1037680 RepID=A0A4U1D046_9BACI|nr:(S)-benzoin forming benzil reductase [Robertmurraya kyonggiensis]TKC15374.1 (S)-benzoin forming benzil reductase [Robertmurraya kyonggiensis]